jgi:uncharacterized protein involved in tellurium resistance
MKKILLFIFITLSLQSYSQNDYLVTINGNGSLKLDTKLSEVEKLLGKKFTLKNVNDKEGSWIDTVKTKYKNTDIILYFERQYEDDVTFNMVLAGMQVSNPLYKTNTGIGIGADKMKIITTYEMSRLSVMPDYTDDSYMTLSKTLSTIWVYNDESENTLVFHLKNKKVVSIELMRFYGD